MGQPELAQYRRKRDFSKTNEPSGEARLVPSEALRFVIQKHAASHLHSDLRLEFHETFKSWAVPKGPSLDPDDRRLAMQVEDHPLEYGDFEGTIPKGQYGGGTVMLWDRGFWAPEKGFEKIGQALAKGELKFVMEGERMHGSWVLVLAPWPRSLVYVGFAGAFLLFGYIPFVFRRHPWADAIKLIFVALDVMLITAAVLNVPAAMVWIDWPFQTRLRSQNFLLLLLLWGGAALTYSPRRMLWTGAWVASVWSLAFAVLYWLPDSVRYGDILAQGTDEGLLTLFLSPTYVSLPQWLVQIVSTVILTVLLATAVHRSRTHLRAHVRADILRADLARYVSPDVADALAGPSSPDFGRPATRRVAVLFADIVGFTGLSERLSPERTFALLRSFQERRARVVFRHRGTLDKFLGDGLMATFGALQDEEDAALRSVQCAFAVADEIDRWNGKRRERGASSLSVAVSVHFGSVVVGNLGGERRVEFTAVGDVVNVASRLEQATREFGCRILVSDDCLAAAAQAGHPPNFDRQEELSVRGRYGRLRVHLAG